MVRGLFICFILADTFLVLSMAAENIQTTFHSKTSSVSYPPVLSPSNEAPAPANRKLGRHHFHKTAQPFIPPSPSPSAPAEVDDQKTLQADEFRLDKHHHMDKSVAGGGVVLGGLATTFLVAVFCYIRATARHKAETTSESNC